MGNYCWNHPRFCIRCTFWMDILFCCVFIFNDCVEKAWGLTWKNLWDRDMEKQSKRLGDDVERHKEENRACKEGEIMATEGKEEE